MNFRVIDTPGLFDTNRDPEEIRTELTTFAKYARHGVSAFIVVLPMGRITPEHEKALIEMHALFGPEFPKHSIVAVTNALTPLPAQRLIARDELLEQVSALPPGHFLRR